MPQSDFSQQEKPVFCLPRDGVSWTFTVPREPLPVWWTKCGTRNDSSAGSRPDRQARGDSGEKESGVAEWGRPPCTGVVALRARCLRRPRSGNKGCCLASLRHVDTRYRLEAFAKLTG